MKTETTEIKISNYRYIPDKYIMSQKFENMAMERHTSLDPFYYLLNYDFDVRPLTTYEVYTYNLFKTTCNFFSRSSNVVEISTDFGFTANRYSEHVRHFYIFEPDKNTRDITRHNLRALKNCYTLDLIDNRQLQNIDSEFMIVRDYGLFLQYQDTITEKLATILLKEDPSFDLSHLRTLGYELYRVSCYVLCVPFYFDKPIHLFKYDK